MKLPTETFVMEQVVNIIDPKGGVIPPIMILKMITIPKCTTSIPIAVTTGTHKCATMINTAPPSRNIPRNSNMILITTSMSQGEPEKTIRASVI